MEDWLFLLLTLLLTITAKLLLSHFFSSSKKQSPSPPPLPPGPTSIPFLTALLWLRRSFSEIESYVRRAASIHGPILTLRLTSRPSIFIYDRRLAHLALVHHGALFADRPIATAASRIVSSNQLTINSSPYGPTWRSLRRNLTAEILHPSRVKSFTSARKWVLDILIKNLKQQAEASDGVVVVMESFQYAMFCLLVLMCFGEKLGEEGIRAIEASQRNLLVSFSKFSVFAFFPKVSKFVFRERWNLLLAIRKRQEELFIPLIRKRRELKKNRGDCNDDSSYVYSYVDSLIDLKLPESGGRGLSDEEIVSLCSEFLNAGSDTTATVLQWVMANLVKEQRIQEKLIKEIEETVSPAAEEVGEEDIPKLQYLKAIILEALRRHPPGHFVLPHKVVDDVVLDGYLVPKKASVNFAVADIGWDEKVWEKPMEFRPERFLEGGEGSDVDLTGSREIKMMPFGAGRRICPGMGLAFLHVEYFVANLVREFRWIPAVGEEVDLTEKQQFTVIMKNPLRAQILSRK